MLTSQRVDCAQGSVENIIELNRISNCVYEASDSGGLYTCGDDGTALTNVGNVLRGNVFSKVATDPRSGCGVHCGAKAICTHATTSALSEPAPNTLLSFQTSTS